MKNNKITDLKTLVIYHKADNDGVLSGALVVYRLQQLTNKTPHYWGVDYDDLNNIWDKGEEEMYKNFHNYKNIIMTDMSFNDPKAMIWMKENIENFVWFDHHKPIIDESINMGFSDINGFRTTDRSALMCVYSYMYHCIQAPECLQILSDYDSWQWVNKGLDESMVMAMNAGYLYMSDLKIKFWLDNLYDILNFSDQILNANAITYGQIINDYESKKNQKMLISADKDWKVDGKKAVAIFNSYPSHSNMFKSLKNTEVKIAVSFKNVENNQWKVGLYNINENESFNCGDYLKEKYGGGGHKGAAGCIISNKQFMKILSNKSL